MNRHVALLLAGILALPLLPGCGGGGGNPGACQGSAEVCEGRNSDNVPTVGASTPTTSTPTTGGSGGVTCASFSSQQQAQVALAGGAFQLDPNGDGIACNEGQ